MKIKLKIQHIGLIIIMGLLITAIVYKIIRPIEEAEEKIIDVPKEKVEDESKGVTSQPEKGKPPIEVKEEGTKSVGKPGSE